MKEQKDILFSITKKDLDVQTFRSGGHGGQHQNKVETGVRIIHRASGAKGESRTEKSQHMNKKLAFERLTKTQQFKSWLKIKTSEALYGKNVIEDKIKKAMQLENIKIEIKQDGKWTEVKKNE